MTVQFLGVRLLYWMFFVLSIGCGLMVFLYWKREVIREKYYKIRFPEKVIKVVVHYPGNLYKAYWRLIPDRDDFTIEGKRYTYNDESILKENDFYVQERDKQLIVKIKNGGETKEYILDDKYKIRKRGTIYPEIHFIFNVPVPINFNEVDKSDIKFSSKDMQDFKENHLFEELLTLEGKKNLMILIMVICGLNFLVTVVLLAKSMGWIK
jgi:hypothetical protein